MRAWMSVLMALMVAVAMTGCAQNTDLGVETVSDQQSTVAQELPQETANKDLWFVLVNGDMPPLVTRALQGGEPQPLDAALADVTGPATALLSEEGEMSLEASGPSGNRTMNVNVALRSWGDSSQGGEAQSTASQSLEVAQEATQTVRTALELFIEALAALQGQQSGTSGLAAEGGAVEATGGAQDFSAQLDMLLKYLKANDGSALSPLLDALRQPTSQPAGSGGG